MNYNTNFYFKRYTIEYKKNKINKDIRKIDNYEKIYQEIMKI